MPRLWSDTIGEHRREVRDAILDAAATLALECGPLSVTMSQIAGTAGIGRATLYKYFPDVEAILQALHERNVDGHVRRLAQIDARALGNARQRLLDVLEAYAQICRQHSRTGVGGLGRRGAHVARAERRLTALIQSVLCEAIRTGDVRDDIPATELAAYCVHALTAAGSLTSRAATLRLVDVVFAGLSPELADVPALSAT